MPSNPGVEFLTILAFLALAVQLSVVYSGGLPATLLKLERVFPANQRVDLSFLKGRDRARHARVLQGIVGGVVDFSVFGTSDPYLFG